MMIEPTMRLLLLLTMIAAIGPMGCEDAHTQRVTVGDRTFTLELALDDAARTQGLMHRKTIAEDGGMLFVFPDARPRSFWMKNCLTDIDAIYLDGLGNVVSIARMTAPAPNTPDSQLERYPSIRPAQFVVELRGGMADKTGIKVGDRIELPNEKLKKRAR